MELKKDINVIHSPTAGNDCLKIFLSNLDGRINTQDLDMFFNPYGKIEHIESWTPKSAVILFADIESIDRVLSKHRKCIINKQEIYIRRFRYGYIERAYMDSSVLFIKPMIHDLSIIWNEKSIRKCFHEYEKNIEKVQIISNTFNAFIRFNDYDTVDRILVQTHMFSINGISIEMKRGKSNQKLIEHDRTHIKRLIEKNRTLKKQIAKQNIDARHEIQLLKHRISELKGELYDFKFRYRR